MLEYAGGIVRGDQKGWPKTAHDELTVPDGRKIGALQSDELARTFLRLGIAGVSHEQGRATNVEAYARHLDDIRRQAADKAVADWLAAHG